MAHFCFCLVRIKYCCSHETTTATKLRLSSVPIQPPRSQSRNDREMTTFPVMTLRTQCRQVSHSVAQCRQVSHSVAKCRKASQSENTLYDTSCPETLFQKPLQSLERPDRIRCKIGRRWRWGSNRDPDFLGPGKTNKQGNI